VTLDLALVRRVMLWASRDRRLDLLPNSGQAAPAAAMPSPSARAAFVSFGELLAWGRQKRSRDFPGHEKLSATKRS
jgi:hypothetical protein